MKLQSWLNSSTAPFFPDALPAEALFLGEAPDTVALCRYGEVPEARWTRADVFTEDWNLRLQRLGGRVRAVSAGPVPGTSVWGEPDRVTSLDDAASSERRIVLWGRRNAGESMWMELRIPHLMTEASKHHPSGHGVTDRDQMVRRQLTVVRYADETTGAVEFQRFAGVEYASTDENDTVLEPMAAT